MKRNNLLILMSGGTTPVINSTLVGIIEEAKKLNNKIKIFSGYPGIDGVLSNNFLNLTRLPKSQLVSLSNMPGSHFTGTTRLKKLNSKEISIFETNLLKKKIKFIINIGGNGTLKQSIDLSQRLKKFDFASCPKTVDNDLGDNKFKKMLYTPGFTSCVKIWKFFLDMINLENLGAHTHDKIIISQTFGRETGFICGSLRFWDPKRKLPIMLLLPEDKQPFKKILSFIKKKLKFYNRLMIFISEGYKIGNINPLYDKSGQIMYGSSKSSCSQELSNKLNQKGIQTRVFNPTILQRVFKYKNDILDLKDQSFAKKVGKFAIKSLLNNKKSFLTGLSAKQNLIHIPFYQCNNLSRKMPKEFINKNYFDVSDKYISYLRKIVSK